MDIADKPVCVGWGERRMSWAVSRLRIGRKRWRSMIESTSVAATHAEVDKSAVYDVVVLRRGVPSAEYIIKAVADSPEAAMEQLRNDERWYPCWVVGHERGPEA